MTSDFKIMITIKSAADKGKGLAVMNKSGYIEEIMSQLVDTNTYRPVDKP